MSTNHDDQSAQFPSLRAGGPDPGTTGPLFIPTPPNPSPPESSAASSGSRTNPLWVVIGVLVLALIGATAMWLTTASDLSTAQQSLGQLQQAEADRDAEAAEVPDLRAVADRYLGDVGFIRGNSDSVSITLTGYGFESSLKSMLHELGFSSAVMDRMLQTRALDGTLEADGKNCNVSWTYHPDDGLQMVFEAAQSS